MAVLGLDYGEKTVGVACTDALGMTVQPLETIFRKEENKLRRTCARIEELIKIHGVDRIVMGLPLNMDGSESDRSALVREFQETLQRRTGLSVTLHDERLTTVEAEEILKEADVPREERKAYIDKIAAALILEDFMNGEKKHE